MPNVALNSRIETTKRVTVKENVFWSACDPMEGLQRHLISNQSTNPTVINI